MTNKILATVVIYQKKPAESSTLISLSSLKCQWKDHVRLLLWDNSPEPWDEGTTDQAKKMLGLPMEYRHNGGANIGLSTLYNRTIAELSDDEFIWLLDDDSHFDSSILEQMEKAVDECPAIDLFLPLVYSNHRLVSPAQMKLFKGRFLKEIKPGVTSSKNRTAINSGMMIHSRYLKGDFEGYDEELTFYGTDNDFMMKYRRQRKQFYVIDYNMTHSLDFYEKDESYEKKSARFVEQNRAWIHLMRREGWLATIAVQLYLFAFSCKYAIVHHDLRYMFITWTRK